MGISINGPSGIDTQYIIDSLVAIEKEKVTRVEKQKVSYQGKIEAYSKFSSLLSDLKSKSEALSALTSFDIFKTTSSNEKIVTITGGTGGVDSIYEVESFQLASNEKMISKDNLITSQTASLSSLGIGVGKISIDGAEIEIDSDDTIQDLRYKINSATKSNGDRIGVTASVLKIAEDNYRLVITSKTSGSTGIEYKDITGSTLQDLGIIIDADGNKGTTNQTITSQNNIQSLWLALSEGERVEITGKDRMGKEIAASIVKKSGMSDEDFLKEVEKTFKGMIDASFDTNGKLVITDKTGGSSLLAVNSLKVGSSAETIEVTTYGYEGPGVLSVGKDAFFSVDNVFMSSSTNKAEGFVSGATFNFNAVSNGEKVTVEIKRDIDGIKKEFTELIDSYNSLLRFSRSYTKIADPNDKNAQSGVLAGDSSIRTIVSQINNILHQKFELINTNYTGLSLIGLKTDTSNGELKIDEEKFTKALTENFDEVVNLFITNGISDNNSIKLGRSSKYAISGKYIIEEVDTEHLRIRGINDSTWYTSDARNGDIVTFSEGPLNGVSLTAPVGSIGSGNSAEFTLSKGLSDLLSEQVDELNKAREGFIALRKESLEKSISKADERIERLNAQIENYRLRLVKQFTAMEETLSQLQAQSSKMISGISSLFYRK